MAKLTVSARKPLVWPEMDRSDDGLQGDLRRRRFGRGRCGGLGRCEGSGLSLLDEWTAAELLDTAARRGVDGGRGYGEGVAAMASAMAGEREREGLGENGGVLEVHGAAWSSSIQPRGEEVKQGDGQLRGARCGRRRAPACLPGRQAARWSGAGLGRQVGRVLGAR